MEHTCEMCNWVGDSKRVFKQHLESKSHQQQQKIADLEARVKELESESYLDMLQRSDRATLIEVCKKKKIQWEKTDDELRMLLLISYRD